MPKLYSALLLFSSVQPFIGYFCLYCRKYTEFTHEHEEASKDVTHYLSNPLNSFLLVKRLTSDWKDVEAIIKSDINQGKIKSTYSLVWHGSAIALNDDSRVHIIWWESVRKCIYNVAFKHLKCNMSILRLTNVDYLVHSYDNHKLSQWRSNGGAVYWTNGSVS